MCYWASTGRVPLALVTYVPGAAAAAGILYRLYRWLLPPDPLVAFGHPSEDASPGIYLLGGSEEDFQRQVAENERIRLISLTFSYLIESKGGTALRNVTTGVYTDDGREHQFDAWFVQILAAHETAPVERVEVPKELHAGLTDSDRAVRFTFWARFHDAQGRRWEARYRPRERDLTYKLLFRGRFIPRRRHA